MLRSFLSSLVVSFLLVLGARAQCNPQWLPGDPVPSPRGQVEAMLSWDPDGAGPAVPVLVVAGWFLVADQPDVQVATYDGTQWQRLGGPLPTACCALTVYNGQLIAVCSSTVHAWNGTVWQTIGTAGVSAFLTAAVVFQGELVVGGIGLTAINGAPVDHVARWNGSSWLALGAGVNGGVQALASYTFGTQPGLFVGGNFTTAGGQSMANLAVWTGTTWVAPAAPNGTVTSMGVRLTASVTTSHLFVGGSFSQVGSVAANGVARFNASTGVWAPMSLPAPATAASRLLVRGVGLSGYECVAVVDGSLQRWTGSNWNLVGGSPAIPGALSLCVGYHGGRYHVADRVHAEHVASFDGTAWQRVVGPGIDGKVHAVLADGDLAIIAGDFRTISGAVTNGIARGDSNAWSPLGAGVTGGVGTVHAIAWLPDGRLVAGGDFRQLQGAVADSLAVWDGVAWSPLGGGTNGNVFALHVLPNGDLLVGGDFTLAGTTAATNVARWNGVTWAPLGLGLSNGAVLTLGDANGGILAGGSFLAGTGPGGLGTYASKVAWFTNGSWQNIGSGTNGVVSGCTRTAAGKMLVVGNFTSGNGNAVECLAEVTSSTFYPVPDVSMAPTSGSDVTAVIELPNQGLVVGGKSLSARANPSAPPTFDCVQRYDPWSGTWTRLLVQTGDGRMAFAVAANGDLLCSNTRKVGGLVSSGFARLHITCPATATSYGTACPGAGGPLTLRATTMPWLRTTHRAETTGFAANMVGLAGVGFAAAAVPLPLLVPGSGPCDLLVDPVLLTPVLPVGGVGAHAVAMPSSIAFVGASLFEQVVALAFAPDGSISGLHGSNGLQLVLGALY